MYYSFHQEDDRGINEYTDHQQIFMYDDEYPEFSCETDAVEFLLDNMQERYDITQDPNDMRVILAIQKGYYSVLCDATKTYAALWVDTTNIPK